MFRSPTLGHAVSYLGAMFGATAVNGASALVGGEIYTRSALFVMAVCAFISFQPVEVCDWAGTLTWQKDSVMFPAKASNLTFDTYCTPSLPLRRSAR
jgi:hypothetical protein